MANGKEQMTIAKLMVMVMVRFLVYRLWQAISFHFFFINKHFHFISIMRQKILKKHTLPLTHARQYSTNRMYTIQITLTNYANSPRKPKRW